MAATRKRKHPEEELEEEFSEEVEEVAEKKRRRVMFENVTVFHFSRRQGHTCVPSQGGNTLGMEAGHHSTEVMSLDQHAARRWRESREPPVTQGDQGGPVIRTSEAVPGEPGDHTDPGGEEGDFTSILLPVDSKERRVLLRRAGVTEIDTREKEECRELRVSRQTCGCTCQLYCLPDTCPCAKDNIKCQVDRPGFPCGCTAEACLNKTGRLEFNPVKVRTHFVRTIMRTRLEAARDLQSHNCGSYLPSGTLGYLAQMYTRQEMAQGSGQGYHEVGGSSSSSSSLPQHWLPQNSWSLDNPWWTFSGAEASGIVLDHSEDAGEEAQEDTESEESEQEVDTDILGHDQLEEVEETVVTDDMELVPSLAQVDVSQIIDNVVEHVVSEEREPVTESCVEEEDNDEGIGTDNSEAAHTDSDSGKGEDDSIDRSDYGDSEAKSDEDCAQTDDNAISRNSESLIIDHETSSFQSTCPCIESVPA